MKLRAAAILVLFCLGVFALHTVKGSIGSQAMRPHSCIHPSSRKLTIENLVSYERQDGPVKAIIFRNKNGNKICVKADEEWVQTAIEKIDQNRATKGKEPHKVSKAN